MLLLPVRSVRIGLEEENAVVLCTYFVKCGARSATLHLTWCITVFYPSLCTPDLRYAVYTGRAGQVAVK